MCEVSQYKGAIKRHHISSSDVMEEIENQFSESNTF